MFLTMLRCVASSIVDFVGSTCYSLVLENDLIVPV